MTSARHSGWNFSFQPSGIDFFVSPVLWMQEQVDCWAFYTPKWGVFLLWNGFLTVLLHWRHRKDFLLQVVTLLLRSQRLVIVFHYTSILLLQRPEFLLSITAEQDFNAICLSSYRTACKLRFIQKRCNCKSYQNKLFQTNMNIDGTISLTFFSQTSAFDRHIQCDWGCAGHWSECGGAERWHLSDQTGEPGVLNVQPAQQAPTYHSHHQPERKRSPAGGLFTDCCWVVTTEKSTFKPICCKSPSLILVNMILSVSLIAVWQCSQWRPCYPCCVEANLWINSAVSTCSCKYTPKKTKRVLVLIRIFLTLSISISFFHVLPHCCKYAVLSFVGVGWYSVHLRYFGLQYCMDSRITSINMSIGRDYEQTLKRDKEALKRYNLLGTKVRLVRIPLGAAWQVRHFLSEGKLTLVARYWLFKWRLLGCLNSSMMVVRKMASEVGVAKGWRRGELL